MTLPKDRLRKIYGVAESTVPADEAVLARRKYHEAVALWLAKWLVPLQAFFASIGFFMILLPVLSKTWRNIVESVPILAYVFHAYSTFSGLAIVNPLCFDGDIPYQELAHQNSSRWRCFCDIQKYRESGAFSKNEKRRIRLLD
ncbi:hypothetical protein [Tepidiphilus margaritifer]|uniref:hypothetical protein n=1 Tax=Tepidiphilus margaritifer TaxID=203471 RepID=UPI0012FB1608|nr:hypothetical protein [Tepidiphilus margaritifer]